ncbi:hypothetical protein [Pseudomonas auratipiscis]|uniref:DUF4760 domain-containing protein n=1 Tax=Pseudomonas auratipiscis TaxID=3115853 RepID=A0AB35WY00_9PSED|nr:MULTISPECIES: hypothetical protein [unclassified Pseudomonas]MEE1868212.1 hypothetical protein [Pseudomonas sp. 120P]MEE1957161.1 hypothetical protein [Pseudomonas sp. 119P]
MAVDVVKTVAGDPIYADVTFYLSIAAALVSLATLTVGYTQMKIASAKVKLDLYNKRFNVYLSALEYYQSVWGKNDGELKIKAAEFIKCYRESQFLFSEKDGLYKTLTSIKDAGGVIALYQEMIAEGKQGDAMHSLHEKSVDAREKMGKAIQILEQQMAKYINFKVVRGWSFWW